jgi:ADP-ribose pyrophosphatase YjhB (NUDIX family)
MDAGLTGPWRPGWPRLRHRLFHLWFVLRRPITFGVRGLVHDHRQNTVLLVRHTYVPGWQLPGGGVEPGEAAADALGRELREEANVLLTAPPVLKSLHFNRNASRRDHVALYLVENFEIGAPKLPDREIAEAAFFALGALPDETSPATRRRLAEVFDGLPASPDW